VDIELDFSTRSSFCYEMWVDVEGSVGPGADNGFRNSAHGAVCLRPVGEDGTLSARMGSLDVVSDLLDTTQLLDIRRRLQADSLRVRWAEGSLAPVGSAIPVSVAVGEWDLYHVVARAVPSLPSGAVEPGATWERQRRVPLAASFGNAVRHIYRAFTLDSVVRSDGSRHAHVSWRLSQGIELEDETRSAVPGGIPMRGKGRGGAVIDLDAGALLSAWTAFDAAGGQDSAAVRWTERVEVRLDAGVCEGSEWCGR
jgi:hypothetical protein